MGRKGNCFSSVKKALSPDSKEKKDEKSDKSKKKLFGKQKLLDSDSTSLGTVTLPPLPPQEEVKLTNVETEQKNHDCLVEVAPTVDDEPMVPPVVEVVKRPHFAGKTGEQVAAIRIQTAFRGYLARKSLHSLRGLVRLKTLMEGSVVKCQATNTLRCMQALARVQSQIRSRRMRMLEENQALKKQLLQKHERELEKLRLGEEWDDSLQSKEQIEASLLSKHEAAVKRERALAYAFSHQQTLKNSTRSPNLMFMDPRNPTWGWSWLERWMAGHPWESRGMIDKDVQNDQSSVKSSNISGGEINKSYAHFLLNSEKSSPAASQKQNHSLFQSPSTPKTASSTVPKKVKSASPRGSRVMDDDTKSLISVQSGRFRRHSIAGSSIRDDESLASTQTLPSYMVTTECARAKSRLQSPLGAEKNGFPKKGPIESAKKRLSFPVSPARPRRHSGPPKVETFTVLENNEINGIVS